VRSLVVALAAVAAFLGTAGAGTSSFTRYLGGGNSRTDCMLVTDVAGAAGRRAARCTDGDPACDGDGAVNGTCLFRLRVCLDATEPGIPRCAADVVTGVVADLPSLEAALQALAMPVDTPDTCTADVAVAVAPGRTVIRASATMASGHSDRDRLALVCRRAGRPATFATIQRKIFALSCAVESCHGAGSAGGLTLSNDVAYANLVGAEPTNPVARAAGLLRVAPGDPARSFLLDKLMGALVAGEGAPMPQVGAALPAARIDLVRRWIAAGAPADAPF
jgi:hypothetical protein